MGGAVGVSQGDGCGALGGWGDECSVVPGGTGTKERAAGGGGGEGVEGAHRRVCVRRSRRVTGEQRRRPRSTPRDEAVRSGGPAGGRSAGGSYFFGGVGPSLVAPGASPPCPLRRAVHVTEMQGYGLLPVRGPTWC